MLSVGVDIPKLGLMMVNGQPKSMAEYIQATSRVGRTTDGPGLVVTLYNDGKIRDRAHFETFKTWHSALYRSVEASSITPFASRARDKALHAPLIAMARHKLGLKRPRLGESDKQNIQQSLLPLIEKRIDRIDPREKNAALNELLEFLDYWQSDPNSKASGTTMGQSNLCSFLQKKRPQEKPPVNRRLMQGRPQIQVRNVEPSTLFKVREAVYLSQESNDEGVRMAKYELGEIRRSQLLQNGPGAIIDFRAGDQGGGPVSVLTSGLEHWEQSAKIFAPINIDTNVVFEPRLQAKLNKRYFRQSPVVLEDKKKEDDSYQPHIQGVRFPGWMVCPVCDRLARAKEFSSDIGDPRGGVRVVVKMLGLECMLFLSVLLLRVSKVISKISLGNTSWRDHQVESVKVVAVDWY